MGICAGENKKKRHKIKKGTLSDEDEEELDITFHVGKSISAKSFITENKGNISEVYQLHKGILGKGGFGYVKKATHKLTGFVRAIKCIKKRPELQIEKLIKEVDILKEIDHASVLRIYEYYQDCHYFYIVSELCTGGELFNRIIQRKAFDEKDAVLIMKQLLSSLQYLHKHNIVHRDLKPENILYTDKESDHIKLIDFGLSEYTTPFENLTKKLGTPYYIAPEVINKNYTNKCDIWSAGVILYILLCGRPPFNGPNKKAIMNKVRIGKFSMDSKLWFGISFEAQDLVCKMLNLDYENRISARQCLKHKWFKMIKYVKPAKGKMRSALKNMKSFHSNTQLQQATFAYITNFFMAKKEEKELMESFKAFDTNHDGELTPKEIKKAYQKIGKTPLINDIDINEILKEVDLDRSGTITYQEFIMATANKRKLMSAKRLNEVFNMFDSDSNGFLELDDLQILFGLEMGEKELKQMIEEADKDNDKRISFLEFKDLVLKFL